MSIKYSLFTAEQLHDFIEEHRVSPTPTIINIHFSAFSLSDEANRYLAAAQAQGQLEWNFRPPNAPADPDFTPWGSEAPRSASAVRPPLPLPSVDQTAQNPAYESGAVREAFRIGGHDIQYVEASLLPGESIVAEAGALLHKGAAITMETIAGGLAGKNASVIGSLMSPLKRMMSGEGFFVTAFTNKGETEQVVAFGAPIPGSIVPLALDTYGGEIICQRGAFLCGMTGVAVSATIAKKVGFAMFGGEGLMLQKLMGENVAFIHAGGSVIEKHLSHGESLHVETGSLVAWQGTVTYDIEMVKGVKNLLFAQEGLAITKLTGPGSCWIQTLPFDRLVGRLQSALDGQNKGKK